MKRRALVSTLPLIFGLSGCLGIGSKDNLGTTTPTATETTSDEPTPTTEGPTTTETDHATSTATTAEFREGYQLVSVSVNEGFSNEVTLEADCRDQDYLISPGEELQLDRESDGETCEIHLFADGENIYHTHINGYEAYRVFVKENGEVQGAPLVT